MTVRVKRVGDHFVVEDLFDGSIYPGEYPNTIKAQIAANKMEERSKMENKNTTEKRGRKRD